MNNVIVKVWCFHVEVVVSQWIQETCFPFNKNVVNKLNATNPSFPFIPVFDLGGAFMEQTRVFHSYQSLILVQHFWNLSAIIHPISESSSLFVKFRLRQNYHQMYLSMLLRCFSLLVIVTVCRVTEPLTRNSGSERLDMRIVKPSFGVGRSN